MKKSLRECAVLLLSSGMAVSAVVQIRPFSFNLTYADILYLLGALLWLFHLARSARPLVQFIQQNRAYLLCALLFMLGASASLVNAYRPVDALISMAQYGFVFGVLTPLFSMVFQTAQEKRRLLICFAASGHIAAGLAVADFIGLMPFQIPGLALRSGRYMSTLNNANAFALVMAMGLPISLALAAAPGRRAARWYFAFGTALNAYGLALSASLGGFLGGAFGLGAFAVLIVSAQKGRARRRTVLGLAASVAVIAGGAFYGFSAAERLPIPTRFLERVASLSSIQEAENYGTRAELAAHGFKTLSKQLLVGVGQEQHKEITPTGHSVHVNYLLVLVENGLIGFVGYVGMIGALLLKAFRLIRASPAEKTPAIGLTASFLALLAILCVHTNVHMRYAWAGAFVISAYGNLYGAGRRMDGDAGMTVGKDGGTEETALNQKRT